METKQRQYQGVQLSKKESELVQWLMKGEHTFQDAFYMYPSRRKKKSIGTGLIEKMWFNSTLEKLHKKSLCKNVPFVVRWFQWRNPGIEASKANFVALSIQTTNAEANQLSKKIV
jgi:hypothetical protein